MAAEQGKERILRMREVETRAGIKRATLYRRIAEGSFPKGRDLGGKSVGWWESEVDAWVRGRGVAPRQAA